jgi:hypothetical protein
MAINSRMCGWGLSNTAIGVVIVQTCGMSWTIAET